MKVTINRQKLGFEDLLFGLGQVTQTRSGQDVQVTKINAGTLPFNETQSLLEWAQAVNLEELGNSIEELNNLSNNLPAILAVNSNETNINTLAPLTTQLQALYDNIAAIQTNYSSIEDINLVADNIVGINNVAAQIIPNLTEILNVDTLAAQVSNDRDDVAAMKLAVETIYDTFDDRFLGTKTEDPTLDNDGNPLLDGALYFNTTSNAMKVYDLGTTTWLTIPQIYLSTLQDVILTSLSSGEILRWNGAKWENYNIYSTENNWVEKQNFTNLQFLGGTGTQGTVSWNNEDNTLDVILNDSVTLQVGEELLKIGLNNSGEPIPNGSAVYKTGALGASGRITIGKFIADGSIPSQTYLGLATEDIGIGEEGFITCAGNVRGIDTSSFSENDSIYVSPTVAGALTNVRPTAPDLKVLVGVVINSHAVNGTVCTKITRNITLDDIDGVEANGGVVDGDILQYNATNGRYELVNLDTLLNAKQDTITGGASTIADTDLAASKALVSDSSGKVAVSAVTATELGYMSGATSNVQTQLDDRYTKAEVAGAFGRLASPLLDLPLTNSLEMRSGTGSVTFTRSSTATYIDRYGVLKYADIDEPRFEKDGLLIEGASTNLLKYSSKLGATPNYGAAVVTENYSVAPDGTNTSNRVVFSAANQTWGQVVTGITGETVSLSVWIKGTAGETIQISMSGSDKLVTLTGDWVRYTLENIVPIGDNVSYVNTWGGATARDIEVWGAQLEALPFASSYIPTQGSAVTRSADSCELTYYGNIPSDNTPQSFVAETSIIGFLGGNQNVFQAIPSVRRRMWFTDNHIKYGNGSVVLDNSVNVNTTYLVCGIRNQTSDKLYVDGTLVDNTESQNDTTNTPDNVFHIGRENLDDFLYGHIKNLRIYDKALTDTEVKLLSEGVI